MKTESIEERIISQTANDYDLSYEIVEKHYINYGGTPEFYDALEEELEIRRKRNNQ